jgi:hypothetical protein
MIPAVPLILVIDSLEYYIALTVENCKLIV